MSFSGPGYGKSFVFQAIPLMADLLEDQVGGTMHYRHNYKFSVSLVFLFVLILEQFAYIKLD